jgi:diguanylate cyclase (GGDEF)-like protein
MATDVARRMLLAGLAVGCLALLPFLRHDAGSSVAFLPVTLAAVVLCDLLTGALLVVGYLARGAATLLGLACAYVFAGLMALLQALLLPGVLADDGVLHAGSHAPTWAWAIAHAGLPLALAAAVWGGPAELRRAVAAPSARRGLLAAGACLVVALAVGVIARTLIAVGDRLPAVTVGAGLSDLGVATAPVVVGIDVLVLFLVARRARRSDLERRLLLVAGCLLAGTVLAVAASHRFTVGWYAGWALELVASAIVLATLLAQAGRLGSLGAADARAGATDELTGVLSRGAALVAAEHLHAARAPGRPLGLALVDVDGLQAIASAHGALAADAVLLTVADRLRGQLRDADVLARAGDEGFIVILPDTDVDGVTLAIDRAVAAVRAEPVGTWAHDVRTTASGGIAMVGEGADAVPEAVAAAGRALNRAKAHGRDQVVSPARGVVVPLPRAGAGPRRG